MISIRVYLIAAACLFVIHHGSLDAQQPGNANPAYRQLRNLLPSGEVIAVKSLEIKRDAATLSLRDGNIAFYGEVNGKVTGAVFKGEGHIHLTPPTAEERHNLALLTHAEEFDDDFDQVVLRFTDTTADQLRAASAGTGTADHAFTNAAIDARNLERTKLLQNVDLRLLEDVLSPVSGGYFLAAIHGRKNPHLFFTVDPHGASGVEPEEISLMNWNDWGKAYLTAFQSGAGDARGAPESGMRLLPYLVDHEDLDVTIEKGGFLTGLATVHLTAVQDGVAVVPLNLYPTLRVSEVETDRANSLDYIQEKKDEDADFGVVLAQPLKKGESVTVRIAYGGKDVVRNEGNSNYYPIARENWYPNASQELGDYATYHMTFHVPKGLQLIATGTKVNELSEGKVTTTEWKTDEPLPVVGFNLGDFAMKEATVPEKSGDNLTIDAYANTQPPDILSSGNLSDNMPRAQTPAASDMGTYPIGKINTAGMLPMQLSQAQVAAEIYSNYFGAIPFSKIAVTQQFACNYGQSWPMLVYLPICGFLDSTQQVALGLQPWDMYWKVVTPHEVAHQWWGQVVGFRSYRDQWMSEGFAQESASIFLLATRPKPDDYLEFWKDQRKLITEKNSMGFRPIDVGPVTMGFRLNTDRTGWGVYQSLVYPKGAFILHMIQMMMWDRHDGDKLFMETMHDFVETYRMQAASTEDFKTIVEKHMAPSMNLDGNGRMDWFFNEYVYGTDLPVYHFDSQITTNENGPALHFKLTQSGVSPDFKMLVPIYLELADGKTIRLGEIRIAGDETLERSVQLPKFPETIKRASINNYYDVLCTEN